MGVHRNVQPLPPAGFERAPCPQSLPFESPERPTYQPRQKSKKKPPPRFFSPYLEQKSYMPEDFNLWSLFCKETLANLDRDRF
jgi:hypothetical protein